MTLTPEATMAAERAPTVQAGVEVEPAVVLDEVTKVYGRSVVALDKLSLTVGRGEFVCLVGASGCGKSTLLSIISGLDSATAGSVETFGRHPALMFQESALFPWLTVAANVELALRLRGVGKDERRQEGRASCSTSSRSATSRASARTSCPVGCASASRWRAPSPRTATSC